MTTNHEFQQSCDEWERSFAGICKDCNNGTMNNDNNPAFSLESDNSGEFYICNRCGSTHLDLV